MANETVSLGTRPLAEVHAGQRVRIDGKVHRIAVMLHVPYGRELHLDNGVCVYVHNDTPVEVVA